MLPRNDQDAPDELLLAYPISKRVNDASSGCAVCSWRSAARDLIQHGCLVARQLQAGRRQVFTQMCYRRGAGNQQNVGCALQQPRERHLHGRSTEARC